MLTSVLSTPMFRLYISAGNAKRPEIFKRRGCHPADPSEIKLHVLPSHTFVAMSDVEQGVQQMLAAGAEAVPASLVPRGVAEHESTPGDRRTSSLLPVSPPSLQKGA